MATEKLNFNAYDGGWTSGGITDVDEAVAAADGLFITTTIKNDIAKMGLDDSVVVDSDTVTAIDVVVRARTNGSGNDSLGVELLIGGVVQGVRQDQVLTGSFVNLNFSDAAWDADWTEAQMDGMEIQLHARQSGMPTTAGHEVDCGDIDVVFSSGGPTFTQDVEGTLSFAGAMVRQTNKNVAGVLTFAGAIVKAISVSIDGVLSFAGILIRQTRIAVAGVLDFVGDLSSTVVFIKDDLAGTLTFAGGIVKRPEKNVAGALSFAGANVRQTNKNVAGTLTFDGVIGKLVSKRLAGELSFVGTLATTILVSKAVTGTLSFIGGLMTTFIPGSADVVRRMWRSLWSRVWKDLGKIDEDI